MLRSLNSENRVKVQVATLIDQLQLERSIFDIWSLKNKKILKFIRGNNVVRLGKRENKWDGRQVWGNFIACTSEGQEKENMKEKEEHGGVRSPTQV